MIGLQVFYILEDIMSGPGVFILTGVLFVRCIVTCSSSHVASNRYQTYLIRMICLQVFYMLDIMSGPGVLMLTGVLTSTHCQVCCYLFFQQCCIESLPDIPDQVAVFKRRVFSSCNALGPYGTCSNWICYKT